MYGKMIAFGFWSKMLSTNQIARSCVSNYFLNSMMNHLYFWRKDKHQRKKETEILSSDVRG